MFSAFRAKEKDIPLVFLSSSVITDIMILVFITNIFCGTVYITLFMTYVIVDFFGWLVDLWYLIGNY